MEDNYTEQSHKEFVDRQKRLAIAETFDKKSDEQKNIIKDIDDEIDDLKKKIEKLKIQKKEEEEKCSNIKAQKLETMISIYNNPSILKSIMNYGHRTTYSKSNLAELEVFSERGFLNDDDFSIESMEKLIAVEKRINEDIPHTNVFFDIMNNLGNKIKFPGEEE